MRWIRQPREAPNEPRLEIGFTDEYEFTVWPDGRWLAYHVPTFKDVGGGKMSNPSLAKKVCGRFAARYNHTFIPGFIDAIQNFTDEN